MALSFEQQFNAGMTALRRGDLDLLTTMLTDPRSVTIDEQRTVAQQLGLKGGLLSFVANTVSDPTVWIAFLLSRRFPTTAWLKGTIPHRFIGAANEFTGISLATRPVESFYRGTNLPKLVALKMRREAEVMKVGRQLFDRFEHRPGWDREMPIVSMLLEGQAAPGATPELRRLAADIRGDMDELWGFLRQTKQINGGFEGEDITKMIVSDLPPNRAGRYLRDYLPHIPNIWSQESVIPVSGREALRRLGRSKIAHQMQLKDLEPTRVWGIQESNQLASNFARYQEFLNNGGANAINPRLFRRQRFNLPLQSETGQELFITDLNVLLEKYVHGVARTFANNAPLTDYERVLAASVVEDATGNLRTIMPTRDPIVAQIVNEGIDATGALMLRRPVPGTPHVRQVVVPGSGNVPMLRGLQTLTRAVQGVSSEDEIWWGNLFSSVYRKLSNAGRRALGRKEISQVDAAIDTFRRGADYRTLSNGIASYFYSTTLGLNPWSAIQNLLQPVLTTAPAIGIGPTLAGMRTLRQRLPDYARNVGRFWRMARQDARLPAVSKINRSLERAFQETFPELARHGIRVDPRLFEIDERALLQGRFRTYDDYAKILLQPFTHTEMSNQIVTFYGAKDALRQAMRRGEWSPPAAVADAAHLEDLLNLEAGQVVNATQFRPGPGSRTVFQSMVPAPLRMFTTFPIRLLNFFTESTVRGAMTNRQLQDAGVLTRLFGGRNWGTVARSFLLGKIVTNGVRESLGVDLGGSLGLTTPFTNIAPSGQWFAPLPSPPAPQLLFNLASYASTRDLKDLQPMIVPGIGEIPFPKSLVPGGIAISRFTRAMNQYRPDMGGFVDNYERLMYRGNTTDLVLASLGLPLDKGRRTREIMERSYANRSMIRDLRRRFAVAATNYDTAEMNRLRLYWQKAFPDLPPLSIAQKDLQRYQENARLPAVQRMLRTLGSRAGYLERHVYEYDPDLLAPQLPAALGLLAGAA